MGNSIRLFLFSIVVLWGASCIITPPPHRHHRRHPRSHHLHRGYKAAQRCHKECVQWGHRNECNRRCHTFRNGVCVEYRDACAPQRYCVRFHRRCNR